MSKYFPFLVSKVAEMTILEQVFCMVWLSENKTLKELREYQCIVEQQFISARENNLPERVFDELGAMQNNYAAAVAYQTFPDLDTWLAFIDIYPEG